MVAHDGGHDGKSDHEERFAAGRDENGVCRGQPGQKAEESGKEIDQRDIEPDGRQIYRCDSTTACLT